MLANGTWLPNASERRVKADVCWYERTVVCMSVGMWRLKGQDVCMYCTKERAFRHLPEDARLSAGVRLMISAWKRMGDSQISAGKQFWSVDHRCVVTSATITATRSVRFQFGAIELLSKLFRRFLKDRDRLLLLRYWSIIFTLVRDVIWRNYCSVDARPAYLACKDAKDQYRFSYEYLAWSQAR